MSAALVSIQTPALQQRGGQNSSRVTSLNTNLTMNVNNSTFTQPNTLAAIRAGGAFAGRTASYSAESGTSNLNRQRYELAPSPTSSSSASMVGSTQSPAPERVDREQSPTSPSIIMTSLVTITNEPWQHEQPRQRDQYSGIRRSRRRRLDHQQRHSTAAAAAASSSGPTIPPTSTRTSRVISLRTSLRTASWSASTRAPVMTVLIDSNTITNVSSDGMEIAQCDSSLTASPRR